LKKFRKKINQNMAYHPKNIFSPRFWQKEKTRKRRPASIKPFSKEILFFRLSLSRLIKTGFAFLILFLIIGIFFLIWLTALFARNLPNPNRLLERSIPLSTKIYDRTGKILLYEIHGGEKRTLVKLSDISPYLKQATIVAEDKNFYRHKGFDLKGIVRALLVDIRKGKAVQGGSTITQQLVKNVIFGREKTLSRKLKELIMAYRLEKNFSKDEILKMYLNEIPYGSNIYGIEAAAHTFFNKKAKDLDLIESAILAALPKAPTYYSPYGSHLEELEERARYIIKAMAEEGYISQEEAEKAQKENILAKIKPPEKNILAPHFVLYVKQLLEEKYGRQLVEEGGLKVITSLDWEMQKIAEEEIRKGAEINEKKYNGGNAALVAINPKSGEVLAMVGSRDYFDEKHDGAVNVALRPRQPGSSFKPIVYAAAFTKGYTPETLLYDVETVFKAYPKDYIPHNYDGKEHGLVTMRQALAGSLNIPAVKTLYLAGVDYVLDLANQMGYTTLKDRSRFGLSLVLGGGEVKLLEHTVAYAVFANEGYYLPPIFILRIEDKTGQVLEEWKPQNPKKVLDRNIALEISDILSDNASRAFIFGTKNPLVLPDRPVAAKTGTTNDWRDGWTLGYTPSLVVGVWVGNNDNTPMKPKSDGVYTAAPIWNAFMQRVLKDKPREDFPKPIKEDVQKPVLRGERTDEVKVVLDKISGKLATQWTPEELREEKIFKQPHCILYFVNKDDPRGPVPEHPENDPQFQNWEEAVLNWAKKQNYPVEAPPQEYDDIHLPEYKPSVIIKQPLENSLINSKEFFTEIEASAPRGIKKVKLFFDDQLIGELTTPPFQTTVSLPNNTLPGFHTFKVKAYDDVLNEGETSLILNFLPQ
jgi:1A family penicillin-binding protein